MTQQLTVEQSRIAGMLDPGKSEPSLAQDKEKQELKREIEELTKDSDIPYIPQVTKEEIEIANEISNNQPLIEGEK